MSFIKPNLFKQFSKLSEKKKWYYHVLKDRDEIDSVVFSLTAILGKPYFKAQESLFDRRLVSKFSEETNESIFTNLEALFIRVLNESKDFERLVESEISTGSKLSKAVSDTFLVNCFEFSFIGPWFSPAGDFLKCYLKWLKKSKFDYLTKDQLVSRHKVYSGEWLKDKKFDGDGADYVGAIETGVVLKIHILQFLKYYCHTSLERNAGLFLETDLFNPIEEHPNTIRDFLSLNHCHPNMNTKGWPERNDREMFSLIDRVRRRLAAYLLTSGFVEKLPESKDRDLNKIREWLMNVSRTTSVQQARTLLNTTQLDPDNVHLKPVNYTEALKDLASYFKSKGVKTSLEHKKDGRSVLSLWWSATEDETRDTAVTKVFSSGIYEDDESGCIGRVGDLV